MRWLAFSLGAFVTVLEMRLGHVAPRKGDFLGIQILASTFAEICFCLPFSLAWQTPKQNGNSWG